MKKCRKHFNIVKTLKGISPVLSVLMMIAIAVAASLVAYAWVMGYLGFTTTKVGKALQVQSMARDDAGNLIVYVQNVGQGTVEFHENQSLYVEDKLQPSASINPTIVEPSQTATMIATYPTMEGEMVKVKVVTADGTFTETTQAPPTIHEYTLTVNNNGEGSVVLNPPGGVYEPGINVQLTAVANPGWAFSGWSGDLSGTANPTNIVINLPKTVTATFVEEHYTLTVNYAGSGSGTVTKDPDQATYTYGNVVTLTANPAGDSVFSGWSGDLSGTTNPESITMNTHKTVTATFLQLIEVTILDEDFESWNLWDATPSSWYLSPDQDHSGSYSAKSTDGQEGYFDCDPVNTGGSVAVTVDFWYRLSGGVDGGDFEVRFYDGSNWDYIVDLGNQGEGSWQHYTYTTTDSQYFKSNFRLRFNSSPDDSSETIWVDDVVIVKTTSALLDDGFEGSSSSWDDNWDATGHDWYRSTTRRSGSYSAGTRDNDEGNFYSDPRDTRNSIAVYVDFWYRVDDLEDSDLQLSYYDGSNYDFITNLGTDPEDTWRHYTDVITDSQYFKSNFRIRFYSSPDDSGENAWIDDVLIVAVKSTDSLLNDGFETWNDKWDTTSSPWLLGGDQDHSGSYSAKSTDGQEGNFDSNPVSTIDAMSMDIDFWYRIDDTETSDLSLYFYDGSTWDKIDDLGGGSQDTWLHYTNTITDSQYFKSNFRIRFTTSLGSGENVWIDDVLITAQITP